MIWLDKEGFTASEACELHCNHIKHQDFVGTARPHETEGGFAIWLEVLFMQLKKNTFWRFGFCHTPVSSSEEGDFRSLSPEEFTKGERYQKSEAQGQKAGFFLGNSDSWQHSLSWSLWLYTGFKKFPEIIRRLNFLYFLFFSLHSLNFFKHNSLLIFWEFHIMHLNPAHLLNPPYPPFTPAACPPKLMKNSSNNNFFFSSPLSHSSGTRRFRIRCIQLAHPQNVHRREHWSDSRSLIFTVIGRSLFPETLLTKPAAAPVIEILRPSFHRTSPFMHSSRGWVVADLISLDHWDCLLRQEAEPALLDPCCLGQLSHAPWPW